MIRARLAAALAAAALLFTPVAPLDLSASHAAAACLSALTPAPGAAQTIPPPAGFAPLQATDAELRCYGFPPRPSGGQALANWTNLMQHFKRWVARIYSI